MKGDVSRRKGTYPSERGRIPTKGDALLAAGGTTESASPVSLNLAARLTDGQMIYVPSAEEAEAAGGGSAPAGILPDTGDDKVNLNTADKEELMTLSGIGESRAEAILSYREEHGGFRSIEEIKEIEGIKDGIFNRIKEQIKVV